MDEERWNEVNKSHSFEELVYLIDNTSDYGKVRDVIRDALTEVKERDRLLITSCYIYGLSIYQIKYKYEIHSFKDTEKRIAAAVKRLKLVYEHLIEEAEEE